MLDLLQTYPATQLVAFTVAGLALNLTPGADVMFATASGLRGGPKAGMAAALGVGLGSALHVSLAALGLSAVIAAHPGALTAIRWIGAAYLLWLAVASWRSGPAEANHNGAQNPMAAIRRGFLANVLNPKVILFILAFLPQFTNPLWGPVWQQILLLGTVFTVTGTLITMGYGALAGALGQRLVRRMSILHKVAGVMFAGLAARLVWE
jgi:threonine/homoserine/homoserine lactone efflux protein